MSLNTTDKRVTVQSLCLCVYGCFIPCFFLFVSYVCACVQHLQEGRKAQQYLEQCWKQMDNVSVAGGRSRHKKRGGGEGGIGVWCKYSVSNGRLHSSFRKNPRDANGGNSRTNQGPSISQMSFSKKIGCQNHELHVRSLCRSKVIRISGCY